MDHAYDKKWEHQSSSWSLKAASQHMIHPILSPSLYHTITPLIWGDGIQEVLLTIGLFISNFIAH